MFAEGSHQSKEEKKPVIAGIFSQGILPQNYFIDERLLLPTRMYQLRLDHRDGREIARSSLLFVVAKAISDATKKKATFRVIGAIGSTVRCMITATEKPEPGAKSLTEMSSEVAETLKSTVAMSLEVEEKKYVLSEAVRLFESLGMGNSARLVLDRNDPVVDVHEYEGFVAVRHTVGVFTYRILNNVTYSLSFEPEDAIDGKPVLPFSIAFTKNSVAHEAAILRDAAAVFKNVGISTAADVNANILRGARAISDMILTCEAQVDQRVAVAAREAHLSHRAKGGNSTIALVAGGATAALKVVSKRLEGFLRGYGSVVKVVDLAEFLKDPKDKDAAADARTTLQSLVDGRQTPVGDGYVELRFLTPPAVYKIPSGTLILLTAPVQLAAALLAAEGGAQPNFTVLTTCGVGLPIDDIQFVREDDIALLRLCALAYGSPALSPEMISEFISDAIDEMGKDVAAAAVLSPKATQIINTALPYELSVLKPLVEPALKSVPMSEPVRRVFDGSNSRKYNYWRCKLLHEMLGAFFALPSALVPKTSPLYEYFSASLRG